MYSLTLTHISLSLCSSCKIEAGYFVGQTMQNNYVCRAVISNMVLLHDDVHNYYIYIHRWPDQFVV